MTRHCTFIKLGLVSHSPIDAHVAQFAFLSSHAFGSNGGGRGVPGGRLHSPQLSRHDAFMYAALRSHSPADAHASHDSVSSWQSAVPFGSFGRDCGSFFGGA